MEHLTLTEKGEICSLLESWSLLNDSHNFYIFLKLFFNQNRIYMSSCCVLDNRPCAYNLAIVNYSLIAFDERVTFWLQRVRSLPCTCAYVALFARRLAHNHYATHTHTMQQTHTHKAVTGRVEAKKLLSRRRQSEYSKQCKQLLKKENV